MKKSIIALSLLISATTGFAKEEVNAALIQELQGKNLLGELRVYVSEKVEAEYQTTLVNERTVEDGDFTAAQRRSVIKEVIGKNIRGKIVALEPYSVQEYNRWSSRYETVVKDALAFLYVSFDRNCLVKECAYRFIRNSDENIYYLNEAPKMLDNHTRSSLQARGIFTSKAASKARLQYNVSELEEVVRSLRHAEGF